MKIRMCSTYEVLRFDDEPDSYPETEGGYTDPNNPWGRLRYEIPEDVVGEAAKQWMEENVQYVEFDSLWEAAEFVVDFPGGVWDYREGEYSTNYRTGDEMSVTLHVEDHQEAVFELADFIQAMKDRKLAKVRSYHNV